MKFGNFPDFPDLARPGGHAGTCQDPRGVSWPPRWWFPECTAGTFHSLASYLCIVSMVGTRINSASKRSLDRRYRTHLLATSVRPTSTKASQYKELLALKPKEREDPVCSPDPAQRRPQETSKAMSRQNPFPTSSLPKWHSLCWPLCE